MTKYYFLESKNGLTFLQLGDYHYSIEDNVSKELFWEGTNISYEAAKEQFDLFCEFD